MNDYYQFRKEDAYEFQRCIGARAHERGTELEFSLCPYCFGGANKDKNTFSINLETGQFECKRSSCGARGNIITLARDFAERFSLPKDVMSYYNIDGRKENFKRFKDAKKEIEVRDPAVEYLKSRGISEEICRRYEVTTMPDQDNVLVFPFKDENGVLQFVKYRKTDFDKNKDKNKEWCISGNYKKILFGMNSCEDFGTLVITEGQIDSLSCAAAGVKNAVSVPTGKTGFTWKPNVWNWLTMFEEIVVFGDNENGIITLAEEISGFFPKRVRIVRHQDYHGYKDANEILQNCGAEAIREAIDNAEAKISFRIKDLADVEKVDLENLTYYRTGFKSLDKVIGNGFHAGELIILTGKCGEGKSTFASMIVGRMLQQEMNCFCYSGELPDYMFKAWLDYQIAGTKQIPDGKRNAISEWYRGRCFIYDNSALIDEKEEIFYVMEQAVRYKKCKFVLIDNLMTAMEDKTKEDLFRQQSEFIGRLTKFAKSFGVIVLLIAHPKKGDSDDNDAISGSGDITNRANLVLRFQRKSKKIEDQNISILKITKNRTTGILNWDGIEMWYDADSMRISECSDKTVEEFMTEPETGSEWVTEVDDADIPF